jgi:hypothetical protein
MTFILLTGAGFSFNWGGQTAGNSSISARLFPSVRAYKASFTCLKPDKARKSSGSGRSPQGFRTSNGCQRSFRKSQRCGLGRMSTPLTPRCLGASGVPRYPSVSGHFQRQPCHPASLLTCVAILPNMASTTASPIRSPPLNSRLQSATATKYGFVIAP